MRLLSKSLRSFIAGSTALAAVAVAAPAAAQDAPAPDFSVTGSVALVTDYRFRGVSQSDKGFAIQGGLTLNHSSGLYAGFWASNLAGWGTFGGPNLELDLFGGFKLPVGGGTLDAGLTWYMYPGGADTTDFGELFAKLSGTTGQLTLLAGAAYAPSQEALGNFSNTPFSRFGDKEDNIYVWGDAAYAIKDTPITLKAHLGYSDGNPGLGPNGTSVAPTGSYFDWLLGVDFAVGPVILGVAYVDTDIDPNSIESLRLQPNFSDADGSSIAGSKVLFSISAAF